MEIKNNVKGTRDLLGGEATVFSAVEGHLSQVAHLFSYNEIRTPVLEQSDVFARGVGEGSDIVRKEMYTFLDKGDRSVTMRPEFTAGIVRSVIQNKLYALEELPIKLFYYGSAFRYERPQLGRYREFHQFGVESIGNNSVYNDIEVIQLAYTMLTSLRLDNVTLKINCLGDEETRTKYREALRNYYLPHLNDMCEDCKNRYELNPLRILDCKVPSDKELNKSAPKISDYLSEASIKRFNIIKDYLTRNNIPFEEDSGLVRGLDYYTEIVFEFAYTSKKGKDYGALGGGGHYGNLVKELGGPDLPGVGFSFGIDRLIDVLKDDEITKAQTPSIELYFMPLGESARSYALELATKLRLYGHRSDMCFDDVKLGNMFKRAARKGARYAVIIGEEEIAKGKVQIKDLLNETQEEVDANSIEQYLYQKRQGSGGCCCSGECGEGDCNCGDNCSCNEECDCNKNGDKK